MKNMRFYLDYNNESNKRTRKDSGNCIAVPIVDGQMIGCMHEYDIRVVAFCAVFLEPNSQVCNGTVSREYLAHCTRRISEKTARKIHPRLFEYLEEG